jgi:hypothetical protein
MPRWGVRAVVALGALVTLFGIAALVTMPMMMGGGAFMIYAVAVIYLGVLAIWLPLRYRRREPA